VSNHKVGLIGMNFSSKVHIPSFLRVGGFDITALCSKNPKNAEKIKNQFKLNCKIFNNPKELIESKNIDVVDIVTPPSTHLSFVKESLRNKKNIICEKPFGLSYKDLRNIDFTKSKKGYVNYLFRTENLLNNLKSKIKRCELGEINRILISWSFVSKNQSIWKKKINSGGNLIDDIFSHVLDYLFFLTDYKSIDIKKFDYHRQKDISFIQEEINGKIILDKKIDVSIEIKKNCNSKFLHKISIFGETKNAVLSYYFPFTPKDKKMIIKKNNRVQNTIYENSKYNNCDDRIISFCNFLKEFKKKKPKNISDLETAAFIRSQLDKFTDYVWK